MAAAYPFLKVFEVGCGNDYPTPIFPTLLIVGKIVALSLVHVNETEHHLVLVKRAVGVVLVYDKHFPSVPTVNVVGEEHVDVVAIHALCATEIAIGVVHLAFPLLALGIGATTYAAFGLLDGDVERTHLHMAFLIVASLFLCLGGFGVHLG